jgi:hypothetical protein
MGFYSAFEVLNRYHLNTHLLYIYIYMCVCVCVCVCVYVYIRGSFQKFCTLYVFSLKMNLFYKIQLQAFNVISIVFYHSGLVGCVHQTLIYSQD